MCIFIVESMGSLDWSITMPSAITGVRGSCVIIPCSYKFKKSQNSGAEVKWYKLSAPKDSLLYDQSTSKITDNFKGKTSLYGSNDKNYSRLRGNMRSKDFFPGWTKSLLKNTTEKM